MYFERFLSVNVNTAFFGIEYFNLSKIFVLMLFKMSKNQKEGIKLEERSVIKFRCSEKRMRNLQNYV